jgi:RNA polymerase sigma factor (sigma-70 family)
MSVTLAEMTTRLTATSAQRMPDTTIDAETTRLAQQAQAGSADAFCVLVELHQRAARRVAAAALGQSPEVDEAVQEACITAWQRIAKLEDPAAFRAWLLRITWRKALDRRRSIAGWLKRFGGGKGPLASPDHTARPPEPGNAARSPSAGLAVRAPVSFTDGGSRTIDTVVDPTVLADEQLLARERDRVVGQLIRSLPSRLRDPFLLAAAGEHRYEDIAAMLGVPLGTVKWRVAEARRVLREKLQRVGFGRERGPHGSRAGE